MRGWCGPRVQCEGLFYDKADAQREAEVATQLEGFFNRKLGRFGDETATIDWYRYDPRVRKYQCDNRVRYLKNVVDGWIELKCRTHRFGDFDSVFISSRKYYALRDRVTKWADALFVVRWSCGQIRYIDVRDIDPNGQPMRVGGHNEPRASNDKEPVIDIMIDNPKLIRVC